MSRRPTAIDDLGDRYVQASVALDPLAATYLGIDGFSDQLTDYSVEGCQARAELDRRTLTELGSLEVGDDVDAVSAAAMRERLTLQVETHDAGLTVGELNTMASPVQTLREAYDVMPALSADDWATIARRMSRTPVAIHRYESALRARLAAGPPVPIRQVTAAGRQIMDFTAPDGYFAKLPARARLADGSALPAAVQADLERATGVAAQAYRELLAMLEAELAPSARPDDAVGRDTYALLSRYFLGAEVDLADTYQWGLAELARIEREAEQVAASITADGSVPAAVAALDADPARRIVGAGAFRDWMQQLADTAIDRLADTHFDIPAPVRRLECRIAPTHSGIIYYTGPTEDFSRPGRMWWAVPQGVDSFSTWRETSIVYHEGVPGHHLQVGQTMYRSDVLNRYRRTLCWVSGHGEGWALYAERLMGELGFLDDPGDRLGLLDSQAFRATRVAVDIGLHCGFAAPAELGGGSWTPDSAWRFLRAHTRMPDPNLRFELDRYLGFPGQAPSYKVGERIWLQVRDEMRRRAGPGFDLQTFHRRALDLGGLGLDVLRQALLGDGPAGPGDRRC